ncbi:putative E3 ubiquitin protein ligase [Escovopsis weberi]|uniref:HECT-type E3 ubiquitin transferase n=1 Tax=Escovopsis weberi TaxID=150374 RepID=A0A0M9VUJ2_ESCWE|nr:putative E3 ubiquitin protein ligase [Escovopsis weberi]
MLYERDSRKRFLPANHWLMTGKLEIEDFINAVIVEEKQNQEQEDDSSDEAEDIMAVTQGDDYRPHSTFASQRLSRHARIERLRATQRRALRERRLAEMGPKLEILKHIPFVVPFEVRVKIFRQFIELDRNRREGGLPNFFARHHGEIRRGKLFEDAFRAFYPLGAGFKDPIQITFFDQFNTPEAGIDGGGVTKEFLISVTAEAFGNVGMFTSNEKGLLYPNPVTVDALREKMRRRGLSELSDAWRDSMSNLLKKYEFLGRIIGKCMYEGILVDLAFAGFFLLKWPSPGPKEENSYKGSINDLQDMDEELYKGLLRLKNYTGDVSELGFDFTVTDQISAQGEQPIKTISRKLIANGDEVPVTNDNRLLYISYTARHRLVVQPALQTAAFLRGLRDIIRPSWLSMFNQSELQRLVGGDSLDIDIDDLRRNTMYSGVYIIGDDGLEHPTIQMFWNVMAGLTDAQRRDVLKYVSSTPRAPLLGFSQLRPKFCIRDAGSDEDRLPSTSTCINLLKLPIYKKESTLREKLLYAVNSGAGFDLS